ncbi:MULTISPECIES: DUF4190 domain-containing protein [unclassified Streptomyces]|uniref:DUF4190 domain-containing protein n=1 Tax=unclassified Streptomyces TaxID=2593676 RepID=UPI001F03B527|nr:MULTISPECIES: DUF4190 domain-containing protein [unclassified Streptomyces]MCH0566300.1 DUF4190 domain-containing protein [Streptomyces sp. MUM 2J]MCH0572972.1 DUF4190 domain-containing protein [Streptomyces sp. MUM 136J]
MSIPPPPGPHQPPAAPGPHQAPGPYGPPYQPWAQGYSPVNRPAPVNGVAIAALVLGLLCCVPGLGLVLGVIALVQIRRRGERGTAMAVTGAVLSAIGLALWAAVLATGAAADMWDGFREGVRGGADSSLVEGRCYVAPGGMGDGDVYDVDEVPCDREHDGEVFHTFTMTGGSSYPGAAAVSDAADDACSAHIGDYVMDSWAVTDDVEVFYLGPTEDTWGLGDRSVACVLGSEQEGQGLTGSLRLDATTLDSDQLAFLRAQSAVDDALGEEPEASPRDDLKAHRAWAGDVRSALSAQLTALRGHVWSAGAEQPVAAWLKDLRAARDAWAKAAAATDADTFAGHYDKGWASVDADSTLGARRALGLTTTPPKWFGGQGSGEGRGGEDGASAGGGGIAV